MILCIDGYNFLHRARSGFKGGDNSITYNFFRNLKALVEEFKPNRVFFVTEGVPRRQLAEMPSYKGNRVIDPTNTAKVAELKDFHRQKDECIELLELCFPVSVVRHPDFEADDTVYNLIKRGTTAVGWTVVSNDSDFIQLLGEFPHVKLYNPMKKEFVVHPGYDYVEWKALRGDGSDNIPGCPGVGDKTATKAMLDPVLFKKLTNDHALTFDRNCELIKFQAWTDEETNQMRSSAPIRDWDRVRQAFETRGFQSMLKDTYWGKFLATFDPLFG